MTTFVSYHTDDDVYRGYGRRLRHSLQVCGVKYVVREVTRKPEGWQANTHGKASLILEVLRLTQAPVVWLDADCMLKRTHLRSLLDYELVARKANGYLIVGTAFRVDYTPEMIEMLELWEQYLLDPNYARIWDDCLLTLAIMNTQHKIKRPFRALYLPTLDRMGIEHANASKVHSLHGADDITPSQLSYGFRTAVYCGDFSKHWTVESAINVE